MKIDYLLEILNYLIITKVSNINNIQIIFYFQSRESLSSDGEGARGDCSSVDSSGSGSEEQPPCDIGLLERLIRTHPVWFLPGIQRAGAFHLLQGKEEGVSFAKQLKYA